MWCGAAVCCQPGLCLSLPRPLQDAVGGVLSLTRFLTGLNCVASFLSWALGTERWVVWMCDLCLSQPGLSTRLSYTSDANTVGRWISWESTSSGLPQSASDSSGCWMVVCWGHGTEGTIVICRLAGQDVWTGNNWRPFSTIDTGTYCCGT